MNTRSPAEQLLSCRTFVSVFRMYAEREKLLDHLVLFPRASIQAMQNTSHGKQGTPYMQKAALLLFPTQMQPNFEGDFLKKCRRTCHTKGKRRLCNPCPHRGGTRCANPAKREIKGSCFNSKAQEKNNSAEHFPPCTYTRRNLNTS